MSLWQRIQLGFKYLFDKVLALLVLVLLLPLFIFIVLRIKRGSPGPAIYKQKRLGRNGKPFTIYKFRTMCDNAVNMGEGIFVTKDDTRITKIGRILRKTSIDELPQLINILKSEMSFIGPRPPLEHHPYSYEGYSQRQKLRFKILPGITGYAQAYGRNKLTWPERIEMDVYYWEKFSLLLDLKILLATLATVFSGKGTYSGRENHEKTIEQKEM